MSVVLGLSLMYVCSFVLSLTAIFSLRILHVYIQVSDKLLESLIFSLCP